MTVAVHLGPRDLAADLRHEALVGLTASPKELAPTWLYDEAGCRHAADVLDRVAADAAMPVLQRAFAAARPLICYSVKTNPNLSLCRLMGEHGAGFDVTSGGELYRALAAGRDDVTVAIDGETKWPSQSGPTCWNSTTPASVIARS